MIEFEFQSCIGLDAVERMEEDGASFIGGAGVSQKLLLGAEAVHDEVVRVGAPPVVLATVAVFGVDGEVFAEGPLASDV